MTSTFYFQLMLAALSDGSPEGWIVFTLLCVLPAICLVTGVWAVVDYRMRRVLG